MEQTVLDTLFSKHPIACQAQPVIVAPDELVHVVGSQEPFRDQPDDRARMLLAMGWLKVEVIRTDLSESDRSGVVAAIQQSARAWMKQNSGDSPDRDQVRWLIEKTRSYESKQQIAQRVWLAAVLYCLGQRGMRFDAESQIHWDGGTTGRIGLSPDAVLDLAWEQKNHETYTASFRQPDGTITRGKGRHRWYIYRLSVDGEAEYLFKRRAQQVNERVALIVASESYATQPQLPRDFYGGDAFQQACIDAQDQQFNHILVLSPQHGVISLDDIVPSDQLWDDIIERRIWSWQIQAMQRLGAYLFGTQSQQRPMTREMNWWAWLNPESTYQFTVFGSGFPIHILVDSLIRAKNRMPASWPGVTFTEQRPGYEIDDMGDDFAFDTDDDYDDEDNDYEAAIQDIDQLLEWAAEFVELVNIYVPPTGEVWELGPDEALVPVRLLTETEMDIEDLLDLLTDITLLLEQQLPVGMLINSGMVVSVLLQITHSLVHHENDAVQELLDVFPEGVLRQYVERIMQEPSEEDRLCGCLALAEQMQLLAITIPGPIGDQLLIWLQTHLALKMRQRILGTEEDENEG
jgi:hypothetical protein